MKRSLLSFVIAGALSTAVFAKDASADNEWKEKAKDAWIDGKAEATLLFNGNLDSFDINTDVVQGKVILTGKVDTAVDKKLAEELVANIDGVTEVDNQLTVLEERMSLDTDEVKDDVERQVEKGVSTLTDAKIATVIKTRLLLDSDISGFDVDVDVKDGKVTLNGTVDTDAMRDLAGEIAKNASDVSGVENNLTIVSQPSDSN